MREGFGKIAFGNQAQSCQDAFKSLLAFHRKMMSPVHGLRLHFACRDQMVRKGNIRKEASIAGAHGFRGCNHRHCFLSISKSSVRLFSGPDAHPSPSWKAVRLLTLQALPPDDKPGWLTAIIHFFLTQPPHREKSAPLKAPHAAYLRVLPGARQG